MKPLEELLLNFTSLNDEPHHLVLCFCYCLKGLNSDLTVGRPKAKQTQSGRKSNQLNYWWYFQMKAFWLSVNPFLTLK